MTQAGVRSLELVAPEAAPGAATPALAAMVEASLCVCLSTLCPALEAVALAGCYATDTVVAALLMRRPFAVRRLRLRQAAGSGAVHPQLLSNARLASAPLDLRELRGPSPAMNKHVLRQELCGSTAQRTRAALGCDTPITCDSAGSD